jgi:fatty acid desaturase
MAAGMRTNQRLHFIYYAARIAAGAVGYAAAVRHGSWVLAVAAAMLTFFPAFSLAHDLVHGTLGLGARGRRWALAAVAQLFLVSGHAMRAVHLRHHARPFADDDLESGGGGQRLGTTLRALPGLFLAMRWKPFGWSRARERRWQVGENIGNLAIAAAAALALPALGPYVLVALALQFLAPVWAGYLPHRGPAWLAALARRLLFVRSPALVNLAFHELHHDHPHVPCHDLPGLALTISSAPSPAPFPGVLSLGARGNLAGA